MTTATMKMAQDTVKAQEFFAAKNAFTTGPVEVSYILKEKKDDFTLVDVREKKDYDKSHLPGALSLPRDQWTSLNGLKKDKANILYCYSETCHLASKAAEEFAAQGFPVMEMQGGFETWSQKSLPLEP